MGDERRTVVGAVIVDSLATPTKVLAARRTRPADLAGMWEFPGGKVEPGETPEAALQREIREELTCEITVGSQLGTWTISDTHELRLFLAEVAAGEPAAGTDHDSLRTLGVDDLSSVGWLPSDQQAIGVLAAHLTSGDAMETADMTPVVEFLEDAEYSVEQPLPAVLQVKGRFSNPERIALAAAAQSGDEPVALWATNHRDDWVLVAWTRPHLVTIVQRGEAPQRWRHRKLPPTMQPDAQTFLEGASSPFDIVTRPKHQPTDAAREVLDSFGITEPAPPGWVAPVVSVPVVVESTVGPKKRATAPREPRVTPTRAAAKPEPVVNVCPRCFMAIPSTGICDNCG